MLPLVSICIPNYNKAAFIGETIDSVYNQNYPNIELIIIDDCSTDHSSEIISNKIINAPFKTTFLQNKENKGICYSMNKAIQIAQGKYYQMIGSDDLLLSNKINNQVSVFENLPDNYAIVFGKSYRMDTLGKYLEQDYFESIDIDPVSLNDVGFEDLLLKNFISSCSNLVRLSAVKEVGMYDETLRVEDWDLWLRLTRKFNLFFINEYDSVYRIVPSSLTNDSKNFGDVYATYCKTILKHTDYSVKAKRNIARNMAALALIVFKYEGKDSKVLLKQNYHLNKSLKSFVLMVSSYLGLKYRYYEILKFKKKETSKELALK